MFDKILALFLTLSVLNYSTGIDLYIFADRFLMLGTIALVCFAFLFCKPQRYLIPKWPIGLMLFCLWHFYAKPFHPLSQHALFNIFFSLIIFYLTLNFAQDFKWVLWVIIGVTLLNILWAIGQYNHIDFIFQNGGGLPAGFLIDHQSLAGYITLALPLFAYYGMAFIIPLIFGVCLNNFTGICVNMVAGVLITLRKGFYPLGFILILGPSIAGFIIQKNFMAKALCRFSLWKETLTAAFLAPFSGYGLGRFIEFGSKVDKLSNVNYFTAKSEPFEFMYEVGAVVGIGIISYILYELVRRYKQAEKTWLLKIISISLLSFGLSICFQSNLRNPKIAPTVMILLGYFYILTEQEGEKQNVSTLHG